MRKLFFVVALWLSGLVSFAQSPVFYVDMGTGAEDGEWTVDENGTMSAEIKGVRCTLVEQINAGLRTWDITFSNTSHVPFQPVKAGIRLGIDTYMDKYPEWLDKYFPTLLNCCRTHFYGYMQTPSGKILGMASPDPVASWSMDYNLAYQEPAGYWFYGHRISSVNIDLMNALPLPQHNPQNLWQLAPGETKHWKLMFADIESPDSFEEDINEMAGIPMIRMEQTSYSAGQRAAFEVIATNPAVRIGKGLDFRMKKISGNKWHVECVLPEAGLYTVEVSSDGFVADGVLTAHQPWETVIRDARAAALKHKQRATSHVESWYGYYSAFIAAKHFPDSTFDAPLCERFDTTMRLLYGNDMMQPLHYDWRIQNTSGTIGMLVDKYEAYDNVEDLKAAARLADWLIGYSQWRDDAYRNKWKTVYTSVIYVAKSMLELYEAEVRYADSLAEEGMDASSWLESSRRHYDSARRAIDQLVESEGDFHTEGEITFEDGMVSCSALQMGMLALMQEEPEQRNHYTEAMLKQLESHNCLTQLRVPDARRRGGTMRYWEAQYDVHIMPNMFNSPHGWSAWRAYATYYAYLLTGQEKWLLETWNAMGAFSNLIDTETGELRWAFVLDPYIRAKQMHEAVATSNPDSLDFGNPHPDMYPHREFVFGEQYVPMVSSWQTRNSQDNDVHEVFKCLGETFLTNAFIVEREDGTVKGYNCNVVRKGRRLVVTPDEPQIRTLHVNLKQSYEIVFDDRKFSTDGAFCGFVCREQQEVMAPKPKTVIFDTDMGNDIDDMLALQMLFNYHKQGKIVLKGITLSKSNPHAIEFVDAYCRYCGFDSMPIGYAYDGANPDDGNYLLPTLNTRIDGRPLMFPLRNIDSGIPQGYEEIRRLLSEEADGSVTLIAVGPLTNIARLLESEGGVELVKQKVAHLYLMSGDFRGTGIAEWNVLQDRESAAIVYEKCPVPITVSGFEVGKDIKYPASSIENDFGEPTEHPLCVAYSHFLKMPYDRPSWDMLAVLEAVEPDCPLFGTSPAGRIKVDGDGVTLFEENKDGLHRYMTVTAENRTKARELLIKKIKP